MDRFDTQNFLMWAMNFLKLQTKTTAYLWERCLLFGQNLGTLVNLAEVNPQNIFLGGLEQNGNDGKYAYVWKDDVMQVSVTIGCKIYWKKMVWILELMRGSFLRVSCRGTFGITSGIEKKHKICLKSWCLTWYYCINTPLIT